MTNWTISDDGQYFISNAIVNNGWVTTRGAPTLFKKREPKSDSINVVKLTEDNIQKVAGHILETVGGKVEVTADRIDVYPSLSFFIGSYIVEDYDYANGLTVFRRASLEERQKYDLR